MTVAGATRMMNGWAQVKMGGKWHQVDHDSRSGRTTLMCDGSTYTNSSLRVHDYRYSPHPEKRCKKKACQAEVEA